MKGLTISQPFASLIAGGEKFVENRRWETLYRGPLAIHAGKGTQYLTAKELREYPSSCIVAVAELVACVHIDQTHDRHLSPEDFERMRRHKHTEGPFCWVLKDVRQLKEPLPCGGAQGLWKVLWPAESQILKRIHAGEATLWPWPSH